MRMTEGWLQVINGVGGICVGALVGLLIIYFIRFLWQTRGMN